MKKLLKILIPLIPILLIYGCLSEKEINLERAVRLSNTLYVRQTTDNKNDSTSFVKLDEITRGSTKWYQLLEFGMNNKEGWSSSFASYNFDYWVGQGTFRLSGWRNGSSAVLTYTDSTGKPVQLTKGINKGELDFLIE